MHLIFHQAHDYTTHFWQYQCYDYFPEKSHFENKRWATPSCHVQSWMHGFFYEQKISWHDEWKLRIHCVLWAVPTKDRWCRTLIVFTGSTRSLQRPFWRQCCEQMGADGIMPFTLGTLNISPGSKWIPKPGSFLAPTTACWTTWETWRWS